MTVEFRGITDAKYDSRTHLNVFLESLARPTGVDLVGTEEVEAAGVDPLSEDVLGQGPRHHLPLQQGHPAVQQAEPENISIFIKIFWKYLENILEIFAHLLVTVHIL